MLQEQRREPMTASTTSSMSSEVSVSTEAHLRRKTELIMDYFEDSKKFVQRALKSDEKGERISALELYNKALNTVQSGLTLLQSSQQVNSAMKELKSKMEKLKNQIKSRMTVLLNEESQSRSHTNTRQSVGIGSDSRLGESVIEGRGGGGGRDSVAEADLVFATTAGAKVFRVSGDGIVSNCTPADSLSIFRYKKKIPGQPPAFLQCGNFVYPLFPGKSPVLRSTNRSYVFPDVNSDQEGTSVGVMLDRMPKDELEELNHVLSVLGDLRESREDSVVSSSAPEPPNKKEGSDDEPTWGSTISEKIGAGVSWVSEKISQGTDKSEELLNKGGIKARENIEPREQPVEIPQPVETGVHYARKASGVVVGVSDFLMTTLAKGTVAVGKKVGTVIAESDMMKDTEINPHAKEAWKVTKSTAKGVGHVYGDLNKAARVLIRSAGKETSKTVEHKYGDQAGRVSDDSLTTAGHVVDLAATYWNWKAWGISFLGKVGTVLSTDDKKETDNTLTDESSTDTSATSRTVTKSTITSNTPPPIRPQYQPVSTKKEKEVVYA